MGGWVMESYKVHENDMVRPYARGCMRNVARGRYTSGPRKGQRCVVKWFHSNLNEASALKYDLKILAKTRQVVRNFNRERVIRQRVSLNSPAVSRHRSRRVLVEPFLHGYRKWNSNSGWTDTSSAWGQVMQALSHYSFHATRGNLVLCDLQGAIYGRSAMLSDPAICSKKKEYGMTDMGAQGISNFFATHRCNRFCSKRWIKPMPKSPSRSPSRPTIVYG